MARLWWQTNTLSQLNISTAVGKIVPGATSLSWRNNADTADNLIITDAGNATLRGTGTITGLLTALAGLTLTGTLTMATAISILVPGATSFSHRNNANNADNLIITDLGAVTIRAGFGCNTKAAQANVVAGAAAPAGGVGAAAGGWDTAANRDTAITMINQMRTTLIANGIMS